MKFYYHFKGTNLQKIISIILKIPSDKKKTFIGLLYKLNEKLQLKSFKRLNILQILNLLEEIS